MTSLNYDVPASGRYLATAVPFALAFSCGAIAALAFRQLGSVFTANTYIATLAGATMAVLAFAFALLAGLRLTEAREQNRRRRAPVMLWVAAIVQAAVLVACIAAAGASAGERLVVIALAAAALGLQTAGARRIAELGDRRNGHLWHRVGSIPALVAGAVTGTAVLAAAPAAAPVISAGAAIAAVVLVRRADLHRH